MRLTGRLAALVLLAAIAPRGAPAGEPRPLDPAAVPWTRLAFAATKLGASATVVVELRLVAADEARRGWLASDEGTPVEPVGPFAVLVESRAEFEGRSFDDRVWLDPASGVASQIEDTERGLRNHRRVYRLMRDGFAFEQTEPAGAREAALDPARWAVSRRAFEPFPLGATITPPLTGPAGVLYALAACVRPPTGGFAATVLVHEQLEAVAVRAGGPAAVETDLVSVAGGVESRVTGLTGVERLLVAGVPLTPTHRLLRVLGLEGDIEMLWDPRRRLPLRVSGEVGLLGRIELRLTRVELR